MANKETWKNTWGQIDWQDDKADDIKKQVNDLIL